MLTINIVRDTYEYPDTDEDIDIDGPTDSEIETIEVSFRDLVSIMLDYDQSSCYPASGSAFEWLSRRHKHFSGDVTEESLHYARENPARNLKYWRAAMKAARFVK